MSQVFSLTLTGVTTRSPTEHRAATPRPVGQPTATDPSSAFQHVFREKCTILSRQWWVGRITNLKTPPPPSLGSCGETFFGYNPLISNLSVPKLKIVPNYSSKIIRFCTESQLDSLSLITRFGGFWIRMGAKTKSGSFWLKILVRSQPLPYAVLTNQNFHFFTLFLINAQHFFLCYCSVSHSFLIYWLKTL